MQVGLVLPQGFFNEFEGWAPGRAWERIVELATTAERLGFESIWTGEHVLSKWPGESIAFDCWTLSAGLAPLVPRVGIGLIVLNSTFHNPAMTAKAAATLDTIAGGRLTLGLGAGFKPNEASAFGYRLPAAPGADGDAVRALRDHLADDPPGRAARSPSAGQHAQVEEVANSPRSARSPGIKLLIGGHGKNYTFRLAARYCDELNINMFPDEVPALLEVFRERCAEIGRDPGDRRAQLRDQPDHALQGPQGDRRAAVRGAARAGLPGPGQGRERRHARRGARRSGASSGSTG